MADIDETFRHIAKLYQHLPSDQIDVPLSLQSQELGNFAKNYLAAASELDRAGFQFWRPRLQLTGHAVELSLKSCLASMDVAPPHKDGHDLVSLYRKAKQLGFALDDRDLAALVHLHHFYFQDLSTQTKFKIRYPAKKNEPLGGAVPDNAVFSSIVDKLLSQANRKRRSSNTA